MISKLISNNSTDLLCERDAAITLCIAPNTLQVWRSTGRYGLPFIKIGSKVRYRREDLNKWLQDRTRSTGATA